MDFIAPLTHMSNKASPVRNCRTGDAFVALLFGCMHRVVRTLPRRCILALQFVGMLAEEVVPAADVFQLRPGPDLDGTAVQIVDPGALQS